MPRFERSLIDFSRFDWLERLPVDVVMDAGQLTPSVLSVPSKSAQEVVNSVVRLVLDLPRGSNPRVVWTQGDSELLIHSDRTKIKCSSGVVTLTVTVECDQSDRISIPIPIGVGTRNSPTGLVMTAFSDIEGPTEIVETWTDSLTAFAWEAVLETAKVIAAEVGKDSQGRSLVPGSIGAAPDLLLIQAVGRHTLSGAI